MQAFDTLKVAQDLETVFSPNQAQMLSKVLFEFITGDLATRHDIDRLEQRIEVDIKRLEQKIEVDIKRLEQKIEVDIKRLEQRIEVDVNRLEQRIEVEVTRLDAKIETQGASIRSEIKEAKLDLIKWIVGALILNFVGSAGLMITLIHNVKP